MALFFLPSFRHIAGTLLFVALGLIALALVVGMGLYYWHMKSLARTSSPGPRVAAPGTFQETWTVGLLRQLEWKRFEQVVTAYSRELGYEARGTQAGTDGGVAVPLFKGGRPQPAMIIRCQGWEASDVGIGPVNDLYDVMTRDQVGYGVFYTPGEFTNEAVEFARGKVLDLVDGREFLGRLKQLEPTLQQQLLEEALRGDYITPTCPGCDIKMVPLPSDGGPTQDFKVWVCRNHPHCTRTLTVSSERKAG